MEANPGAGVFRVMNHMHACVCVYNMYIGWMTGGKSPKAYASEALGWLAYFYKIEK